MWPMKLFHIQTKIFHFFTQILIALQLRQPNFCNLKTLPVKLRQGWNRIFKMQLLEHLIIKSDSSGQKRTHVVLLAGGITKGGSRVSELDQNHWADGMGG